MIFFWRGGLKNFFRGGGGLVIGGRGGWSATNGHQSSVKNPLALCAKVEMRLFFLRSCYHKKKRKVLANLCKVLLASYGSPNFFGTLHWSSEFFFPLACPAVVPRGSWAEACWTPMFSSASLKWYFPQKYRVGLHTWNVGSGQIKWLVPQRMGQLW